MFEKLEEAVEEMFGGEKTKKHGAHAHGSGESGAAPSKSSAADEMFGTGDGPPPDSGVDESSYADMGDRSPQPGFAVDDDTYVDLGADIEAALNDLGAETAFKITGVKPGPAAAKIGASVAEEVGAALGSTVSTKAPTTPPHPVGPPSPVIGVTLQELMSQAEQGPGGRVVVADEVTPGPIIPVQTVQHTVTDLFIPMRRFAERDKLVGLVTALAAFAIIGFTIKLFTSGFAFLGSKDDGKPTFVVPPGPGEA